MTPTLGPDATGLGWVYQYALEDTTGQLDLAELRSLQDWYLRYALTAVPGVAEVATVGGFEKQYQVDIDPAQAARATASPITRVMSAIQNANSDVGAMVMELSEREYMVRGLGYLKSIGDIENVVVGATASGHADPGRRAGPGERRARRCGAASPTSTAAATRWAGSSSCASARTRSTTIDAREGEARGGRSRVCRRAWWCAPVYDRSDLIERAIDTLRGQAGRGVHHRRARLRRLPAPRPLGARRHPHAADRHPHGVHRACAASASAPTSCRSAASPSPSAR